jgi:hypothetical protein
MVNAFRRTYPHCRGAGCSVGTSVPRPAMPMLSRHCPHPIHVLTADIHEFRANVVHIITGLRRATSAHGTKQDRWRSCDGHSTGPPGYRTAAGDRT